MVFVFVPEFIISQSDEFFAVNFFDRCTQLYFDSFEMPETRLLLPNTIVSVEPGIYLPGNFGVRSEIDVVVTTAGHHVTTPKQENILLI